MAKNKNIFVCQQCGATHMKWAGQCSACEEWNTITEEVMPATDGKHVRASLAGDGLAEPVSIAAGDVAPSERMTTGNSECDRVMGGGIVPGSLTLVGGDPGIGKSTLMLQIAHYLADNVGEVLYISGEESYEQTRMRAGRLHCLSDRLMVLAETEFDRLRKHITSGNYCLAVVDSIQSVYSSQLPGVPGSMTQVRECAGEFLRLAKGGGIPIMLVGHVTKDGSIAGPRLLEHLVDTVLYFEGEGKQALRILRSVKNRFGSTNEIGVFEMTDAGLREVPDPSAFFLNERPEGVSGSVVMPSMEGTRPLLVEVQALVGDGAFGAPRRTVHGVNQNRVSLLLAVLEKRADLHFSDRDVFVNVAGGVRLEEPAADLAIALALASSLLDKPLPAGLAAFGEVGLAGEIRAVNMARYRVAESGKFGFASCMLPRNCLADVEQSPVNLIDVSRISDALSLAFDTA